MICPRVANVLQLHPQDVRVYSNQVFLLWRPPALPVEVPPCCSSSPWVRWSPLVLSLCLKWEIQSILMSLFKILTVKGWQWKQMITCANEHYIILPISSTDSVHSDLCEAIVHVGSDEDGPPAHRVDWIIHQRVVTCKLDHIIWETLSGLKAAKCLAGTLMKGSKIMLKS